MRDDDRNNSLRRWPKSKAVQNGRISRPHQLAWRDRLACPARALTCTISNDLTANISTGEGPTSFAHPAEAQSNRMLRTCLLAGYWSNRHTEGRGPLGAGLNGAAATEYGWSLIKLRNAARIHATFRNTFGTVQGTQFEKSSEAPKYRT